LRRCRRRRFGLPVLGFFNRDTLVKACKSLRPRI
jgi:hypothetical protein